MKKRSIKNVSDRAITLKLTEWEKSVDFDSFREGILWYKEAQAFCKQLNEKYDYKFVCLCSRVVLLISQQ